MMGWRGREGEVPPGLGEGSEVMRTGCGATCVSTNQGATRCVIGLKWSSCITGVSSLDLQGTALLQYRQERCWGMSVYVH